MDNEKRDGKCYHVCYPLSLFLENNSYPNQIIRGTFRKPGHPKDGMNHYWLQAKDGSEEIIDPTICQFYPEEQCIVFSKTKPREFEIKPLENNEYELWLNKYSNETYLYDKETFDLSSSLTVTLRAAILINNNISDKKNILLCSNLLHYFEGIYKILDYQIINNQQTIDAFTSQHYEEFEELRKTLLRLKIKK